MIRQDDLHLQHAGTHRKMIDGWSVHTADGFLRFYSDGRVAITLFSERNQGNRQERTLGWFDEGVFCIESKHTAGSKLTGFLFCKDAVDILQPSILAVRDTDGNGSVRDYAVQAQQIVKDRKEKTRTDGSESQYLIPIKCFLKGSDNEWTEQ